MISITASFDEHWPAVIDQVNNNQDGDKKEENDNEERMVIGERQNNGHSRGKMENCLLDLVWLSL